MIEWKSPKNELPPQGKKVLSFHKGDVHIVQRFGNWWLPIPFIDSKYAKYLEPEFWAEFNFPEGFNGKMLIGVDEKKYTIDEYEETFPDDYQIFLNEFIGEMIKQIDKYA